MNDPIQRELLVNKTLRFWNWNRGDNSGPPYLIETDLKDLDDRAEALFARKVKASSTVLSELKVRSQHR